MLVRPTPGGLEDKDIASLYGTQSQPFEDTKECH